jgi:hypothetical protein
LSFVNEGFGTFHAFDDMDALSLSVTDLDLRIKNSRVGLSNWTFAANLPGADHEHISQICDTEIGLLEGLSGLDVDQVVSVHLLLHRWRDLRVTCAGQARPPAQRRHRRASTPKAERAEHRQPPLT